MTLRIGVVMDPIQDIHFKKDTSLAMLWAARQRGWQVEYMELPDLYMKGGQARARTRALEGFKNGRVQALVATDIAARGLDISGLPQVVNFDLPNVSEDYVHRIGRTGRAGAAGHAYSLVCAEEAEYLQGIERLIRRSLPREQVPGFEPTEALPDSVSRQRSSSDRGTPGKRAAGAGRGDGTGQPRRRRRGRGRGRQNARVADSGQR